jgi:hypothetical protein
LLGDNEEIAVSVAKGASVHGLVSSVHVDGVSVAQEGAASAADGVEAIDEIEGRMVGGHVGGAPAQLGGRGDGVGGGAVEIPNEAGVGGATGVEGLVGHRRLDPVQPCSEVAGARGGEGRAGELLGVESQRADQRAVLPARERPRHRLRRQAVAQPRQIYVLQPPLLLLLILRRGGCRCHGHGRWPEEREKDNTTACLLSVSGGFSSPVSHSSSHRLYISSNQLLLLNKNNNNYSLILLLHTSSNLILITNTYSMY